MSYWVQRTKTGRVVYDRPKHQFKWCDARRIGIALDPPKSYDKQMGCFLELFVVMLQEIDANVQFDSFSIEIDGERRSLRDLAMDMKYALRNFDGDFEAFSGGEFGGAGASREFDDNEERPPGAPPAWMLPFYVPPPEEESE